MYTNNLDSIRKFSEELNISTYKKEKNSKNYCYTVSNDRTSLLAVNLTNYPLDFDNPEETKKLFSKRKILLRNFKRSKLNFLFLF